MTYVIAAQCVDHSDQSCVEVCPVDCISADPAVDRKFHIDPEACIDCGACVPVCPVQAIFVLEELPEKWAHFAKMDADWYAKKK